MAICLGVTTNSGQRLLVCVQDRSCPFLRPPTTTFVGEFWPGQLCCNCRDFCPKSSLSTVVAATFQRRSQCQIFTHQKQRKTNEYSNWKWGCLDRSAANRGPSGVPMGFLEGGRVRRGGGELGGWGWLGSGRTGGHKGGKQGWALILFKKREAHTISIARDAISFGGFWLEKRPIATDTWK